ncbi:MAG: hypothetical protein U5N56_07905 [Candidatus Marinimicrobia bacterium]|nr:hypothetical protein [Candidatus Neomarinimicrobiota bacterium]
MSRERLEYSVSCPYCDNNGAIIVSSNDYSFMKNENRSIDEIKGEFLEIICDDNEIILKCNKCEKEFKAR